MLRIQQRPRQTGVPALEQSAFWREKRSTNEWGACVLLDGDTCSGMNEAGKEWGCSRKLGAEGRPTEELAPEGGQEGTCGVGPQGREKQVRGVSKMQQWGRKPGAEWGAWRVKEARGTVAGRGRRACHEGFEQRWRDLTLQAEGYKAEAGKMEGS